MCGKNHTRHGILHAGELSVRRDNLPSGPFQQWISCPVGAGSIHKLSRHTPLRVYEAQDAWAQRYYHYTSDPDIALRAENKTASLAFEALSEALAAKELTMLRSTVDRDDVILDKRPKSTSFKPAEEIVKFQVHPTDPNKTASIGA